MHVIDHDPGFWFLVKNNEEFFMDVNCNHSFVGYTVLIQFNDEEKKQYQEKGREYLKQLANAIQYSGLTKYQDRKINGEHEQQVYNAIMDFNKKTA